MDFAALFSGLLTATKTGPGFAMKNHPVLSALAIVLKWFANKRRIVALDFSGFSGIFTQTQYQYRSNNEQNTGDSKTEIVTRCAVINAGK